MDGPPVALPDSVQDLIFIWSHADVKICSIDDTASREVGTRTNREGSRSGFPVARGKAFASIEDHGPITNTRSHCLVGGRKVCHHSDLLVVRDEH